MRVVIIFLILINTVLAKDFLVGVGGFDCYKNGDNYFVEDKKIKKKTWCSITDALLDKAPNINSISIWITKDWDNSWFKEETVNQYIVGKGYTPIFIFYWFRDDVSIKFIKKNQKKYFKALDKFIAYLKKIKGKKYVILNPEFNQKDVPKWSGFNDLLIKSIKKVKQVKNTQVGFCVGDFGDYDIINEEDEWQIFDPSIKKAVKYADFIAFQEMRALTRNRAHHILNSPYRALAFSRYLYQKYKKPTMLAYSAIPSYGYNGEEIQKEVMKSYVDLMPLFKSYGHLIGINFFHLWDMPKQVGYFKKAEKKFGFLSKEGKEKKSFKYMKEIR